MLTLLMSLLISSPLHALNMGLTVNQTRDKVQNSAGQEDADPFSLGVTVGHEWQVTEKWYFAPRAGYIHNMVNSDDHYSGEYEIETVYLLYDMARPLTDDGSFWGRIGIGVFHKRIEGKGGTVTIPNGAGTATAYRPGKMQQSSSSTLDLGFDWKFTENYGLNFEMFSYEILDEKKRMYALQMGFNAYF